MAIANFRNQYLKTQIETASKEQLVIMLFDGIIRFTEQARKAIDEQQIEDSHHSLMRAQAIIMELICTIDKDKGGEVAQNLLGLHAYAFNCLIVANMKKEVAKIDEVQKIYRELREAWVGAMDRLGISSNAGKPLPAVPAAPASPPAKPVAGLRNDVPAAMPSVSTPPAAPAPDPGRASGYAMGRTAVMAANASNPASLAAQQAVVKQNAMLNAYSSGTRSIA